MRRDRRVKLITLVVIAVLASLALAATAMAAAVDLGLTVTGANSFHAGDTIPYALSASNVNADPAVMGLTLVTPDGAAQTVEASRMWQVGESFSRSFGYVLTGGETVVSAAAQGDVIRAELRASGYNTLDQLDEIDAGVRKTSVLLKPGISIDTTVDFNGDGVFSDSETYYAGPATWRAVISNTGNCPLTVDLSDLTGDASTGSITIARGESQTVTFVSDVTTDLDNTITATGVDAVGGPAGTVAASDGASVKVIAPTLAITVDVDFDGDGEFSPDHEDGWVGDPAVWKITVTNTGTTPLHDVGITDTNGRTFGPIEVLPPGHSVTYTYESVIEEGVTVQATATGLDVLDRTVTAEDDASVTPRQVPVFPDLAITKASDVLKAGPGETITYTVTYVNVGDGPAEGAVIVDDFDERYVRIVDAAGGAVSDGRITWVIDEVIQPGEGASITYTALADPALVPGGTLWVENTVVITTEGDTDHENDTARATVEIDDPYLPFEEETTTPTPEKQTPSPRKQAAEPFLPFTGSEGTPLLVVFTLALFFGVAFRMFDRFGAEQS